MFGGGFIIFDFWLVVGFGSVLWVMGIVDGFLEFRNCVVCIVFICGIWDGWKFWGNDRDFRVFGKWFIV